jgi:hypothetical protein
VSDLRDALDRESERYDLAPGALERTLDRRHQRSQRQRLGALVVALAITGITLWLVVSLGGLGERSSIPANPPSLLEGTWKTARLSERDIVSRFVAAGGTAEEGRAFFAQLGGGAKHYAIITLRFRGGSFVEFESGDGGPPVTGYEATYTVSKAGILTISSPRCTGTYSFSAEDRHLLLTVSHQCDRHDGVYNTTLFASFPLTRQG